LLGFQVPLLIDPRRLLRSIHLPFLLSHSLLVYETSFDGPRDCQGAACVRRVTSDPS
jgi:hypothetical protein